MFLAIFIIGVAAMLIHRPHEPFYDVALPAIIILPYLVGDWWVRRNR
jgi:hypothetical protein